MAKTNGKRARFDPYKSFKFRLSWDGTTVAAVGRVGALRRVTEVITHHEGGDSSAARKTPGRTDYAAVTLERVVTHDAEFEQWAGKAAGGSGAPPQNFRKDLVIECYGKGRRLVAAYKLFRCWVSEFEVLPDPDAEPVVTLRLKLENEGWERDDDAAAPS